MPFMSTKDSKLQWLQFRVNHHIVVANKFLFKIGRTESQLCTFCQAEIESIYHLFWDCIFVQQLICDLKTVLDQNDINFNFRDISFLFGSLDAKATSVPHNLIIMTVKRYIYRCRCLDVPLAIQSLLFDLRQLYTTTRYIAVKSNSLDRFNEIWNDLSFLDNLQ